MMEINLFDTMNREIGLARKWCNNKYDLLKWVKEHRAYDDCRISVFPFLERLGEKEVGDADPSSVIIDKIFVDTDSSYGWEAMKVLNDELCKNGILHRINYSGRFRYYACVPRAIGFHIYAICLPNMEHPKQSLANCQNFLSELAAGKIASEYGLCEDCAVDRATIGDTQRMTRYVNTYNKKWGRWCVPLTQNEIDSLTPFDIYHLGAKPREVPDEEIWLGGDAAWKIPKKFDKPEYDKFTGGNVSVPVSDVEMSQWFDVYNVAPCIRKMAENPYLDYQERFVFAISLKTIGFSEEEVSIILQKTLDTEFYEHAVHGGESIVKRVFELRQKTAFCQGCPFQRQRGYCDGDCGRKHPAYR